MFSIAFRYIFKRLLTTFLMVAPVVILMAWITMSIKYVDLIVSDSLSLLTFFKLVLCVLPGVCGIILPICFLISSIITIHSMQTSKEIIVLMTSGKSALSILNPLLMLGFIVSSIVLYIQTTGSPLAYKNFEDLKEQIKTQISINLLKPESFNVIGESVVYVGERKGTELRDIFISYIPKKKTSNTNIITAKRGAFVMTNGEASIELDNGYRQELSSDNDVIATLQFETLSYDVTHFFKRFYEKSSRVNYLTQSELINEINKSSDESQKRNYIAELHSRILNPFVSLLNALIIGIFLIKARERGKGRLAAMIAFFAGTMSQAVVMLLLNTATKNSSMIIYNYVIMLSAMMLIFGVFLRRSN